MALNEPVAISMDEQEDSKQQEASGAVSEPAVPTVEGASECLLQQEPQAAVEEPGDSKEAATSESGQQSQQEQAAADEVKSSAANCLQQPELQAESAEPGGSKEPASSESAQQGQQEQSAVEETKPSRKRSLRARVLSELGSGDSGEAIARLAASLPEHDSIIAAAKEAEVAKQSAVEEAERCVAECKEAVKEAENSEAQALEHIKEVRKRQREAAGVTALRTKELQDQQDVLVLLEMEATRVKQNKDLAASMESEQDAKRQKIDELLRVVEDAKKAQEEMRQREREAKEAMRQLQKEQKQLSRNCALGAFGRRQRAARKAKDGPPPAQAAALTAPAAGSTAPVKVKQELQPFRRAADIVSITNEVIAIEDSQE